MKKHEDYRVGQVDQESSWTAADIADFYDGAFVTWQRVLGETLVYNFGTRDPDAVLDDAEAHLRYGVRSLYRWIPMGARVLDAG